MISVSTYLFIVFLTLTPPTFDMVPFESAAHCEQVRDQLNKIGSRVEAYCVPRTK